MKKFIDFHIRILDSETGRMWGSRIQITVVLLEELYLNYPLMCRKHGNSRLLGGYNTPFGKFDVYRDENNLDYMVSTC